MVNVVAPDTLFFAYQTSATDPAAESTESEEPASAYVFPASSVTLVMVTGVKTPPPACQPITIRLPLPVAGMIQVDVGKVCGPQEVTWTRLMAGKACETVTPQLVEPPGPRTVGLQATP